VYQCRYGNIFVYGFPGNPSLAGRLNLGCQRLSTLRQRQKGLLRQTPRAAQS
jgi:hypothetical protein